VWSVLYWFDYITVAGMQQGGGQGGQLPPQILADQLTLSQPGGADYAHHSTTCPPGFLTLAASLSCMENLKSVNGNLTNCFGTIYLWSKWRYPLQ